MIRSRITKRYTRALFEIARDEGRVEEIGRDLSALAELVATDEALRDALLSPMLSRDVKAEVLDAVLESAGADPMVGNFLRVLLDARKLPLLGEMAAEYRSMADEEAGRVRGVAVTRMPLPPEDVAALAKALSAAVRKEVHLETREDPTLGGGVIARVGNLVFDSSLRTQLRRMKETLIKG